MVKNISTDWLNEPENDVVVNNKKNFNEKNYLNVKLGKDELEKKLIIRLLPIDKDSTSPFLHIKMHNVKVNTDVSPSGYKSYICLEKTDGDFNEEFGHKCPFCEMNRLAYNKAVECKKNGDVDEAKRYTKISCENIPGDVSISRCIERGAEGDGPKFFKFNLRSDKLDVENQIRELYRNYLDDCKSDGVEPDNWFDLDNGYDLRLTISAVRDKQGNIIPNRTSVKVSKVSKMSALAPDEETKNKWVNDEKKWSDVFVAKPYDYLRLIRDGEIPYFYKKENKWISKTEFEALRNNVQESQDKEKELADEEINKATQALITTSNADDVKIAVNTPKVTAEAISDEDLPF